MLTVKTFCQSVAFWIVLFVVGALVESLTGLKFPANWFEPTLLLTIAMFAASITFVFAAARLTSKIQSPPKPFAKFCLWVLDGCNKNIGSIAINAAAIYALMTALQQLPFKSGLQMVVGGLVIAWFNDALEHRAKLSKNTASK